jgi:hypothetical protein
MTMCDGNDYEGDDDFDTVDGSAKEFVRSRVSYHIIITAIVVIQNSPQIKLILFSCYIVFGVIVGRFPILHSHNADACFISASLGTK